MADMQQKKNIYILLFFLAILFVAIGFERGGKISGEATRQAVTYQETWIIPCTNPQANAVDFAKSLKDYVGCSLSNQNMCSDALQGRVLLGKINIKLTCSPQNSPIFLTSCQTALRSQCPSQIPSPQSPSSSPARGTRIINL